MTPIVEPTPPPAQPSGVPSAERLLRERADRPAPRWQTPLLALFIATFAFLLGSFPARNSDLWWHLAAGRDVAQGQIPFDRSVLPSADPDPGPTWLYDLVSYGVYSVAGGAGLVFAKALLVVGVGVVLLRLSRTGAGWWLPVTCTVLALLAMGTRLLLQPVVASYLLLALTLLVLKDRDETHPNRPVPFLPPWPLALLFAVWANVGSWFVIGLGTVALVWLGRTLDDSTVGGLPRNLLRRGVALGALGAVCLVNPMHVHAFVLPAELGWSGSSVGSAATGLEQVTSPFRRSYLTHFGSSPAGLAYYPLVGFGLLSFALTVRGWRWQRFLPWLGLAVLSAVQVRAVPFFTIVGGPVLAWNLQDIYARRAATVRGGREPSGFGPLTRVLTAALGLAVLVSAWPGWLQAPPFEPRRWAVETPPALERSAMATQRWHREGRLGPHSRALHLSPDTAHAFAWFCPEDRGVLSARVAPSDGTPEHWVARMRDEGITHAVVYDSNRNRLFAALEQFLIDPDQWPLLYLEGDVAVFGWRDPTRTAAGDPFRGWEVDLNQLAFHPAPEKLASREPPGREPQSRRWWESLWRPAPPRPIDRDEAALHLLHADAMRRSAHGRHTPAWEATHAAALAGAAGNWSGPGSLLDAQLRLTLLLPPAAPEADSTDLPPLTRLALASYQRFVFLRDDTPPAILYLAIRAARRALAANPDDAQAHLVLGESYLRLIQSTRERARVRRMPELLQLRSAQASAALNQAVALRPNLAQAHQSLGQLYVELGYLDLATKHFRASLDRLREAGPPRGVTREQFRQQLARAEEVLAPVARAEQEQAQAYANESSGLRVLDRAVLARRKGLAGKARDVLLASDVAAFGPQGMAMELELLTMTGRVQEVREWMSSEHEASLGEGNYRWLRILAAAAAGDYATADEDLAYLAGMARGDVSSDVRDAMALAVGKAVLDDRPGERLSFATLGARVFGRLEFSSRIRSGARTLSQRADVTALRGLLALEVGEVGDAKTAFRQALTHWDADRRTGVDFNGRGIARDSLEWLESAAANPVAADAMRTPTTQGR